LGRFHGIDALAASTPSLTPYHFANNNNNNNKVFSIPSDLEAMFNFGYFGIVLKAIFFNKKKLTMNFKYIIPFLFLLLVISVQGQDDYNSSDYKVSNSDLILSSHEKDSLANALVIYEFGKSHIDDREFDLIFEFKQKLKILNREGFDKANITLYLYNDGKSKETIDNIVATTHNIENGKTINTKLEKSQIFKEKYNDNYTLVKFSMPNVKPGSVITYSYEIESPFIYKYKPWRFQSDIPKLYSEYQTSIPANYEYSIKLVGGLKLDKNDQKIKKYCVYGGNGASADCTETIYVMKNIPAFIEEGFMTTRDNYLSRIEYELKVVEGFDGVTNNITKTWKAVDKELKIDPSIGRQMKKKGLVKGLLSNDIILEKDQLIKSKAIFQFVQKNYIWNEKYNIFKEVSVKDLIKTKSGNVSEVNLLLYNLLIEQGVNAVPVLLSTRNNGLPTKIYPIISDFNYIIIQVIINGEKYFLDATNKFLDFGQIPFRCLNQYGRLLDLKKGSEWVKIQAKNTSIKRYDVSLELTDALELVGEVKYTTTGYHALPIKNSYYDNPRSRLKSYQDKYPEMELSNYKAESKQENDFVFKEFFDVKLETEEVGQDLYVSPFLFNFFETNPFKLQERVFPVDFGYKDTYFYSLKINVGEKFEIIELPKDLLYELPNNKGKVVLKYQIKNNVVSVYFKFDFKEALYDSSYYPYLKEYMNNVVNIQKNTLIVVRRKEV